MKKKSIHIASNFLLTLSFTAIFYACGSKESSPETTEQAQETTATPTNFVSLSNDQIKAINLQLGTLEYKELSQNIKAHGVLRVPNFGRAMVTAIQGGIIKNIRVEWGDYVKKGQVIATIANPQFIQLQEDYLNVQNNIVLAEQEMQRQKELTEGQAGAVKNLQSATAQLNVLRTRKASLAKQLNLLGISTQNVSNDQLVSEVSILSPINGTVKDIIAKIGSYVDVSSPIAEIVDNNSVHLDLEVFERDLSKITIGQKIHFILTNNPTVEYDATVYSIGSTLEELTKTISIHCEVHGNKKGLLDGMDVTGIISLSNSKQPSLPNEAIVESEGKYFVYILNDQPVENGKMFERIEVMKGASDVGYTAIIPVKSMDDKAQVVTKSAFFINAKLNGGESAEH